MDDIFSSGDKKGEAKNNHRDSKKAFEDLFSEGYPKRFSEMSDEEYYKTASEPPRNPKFDKYEDISSGRTDDFYDLGQNEYQKFPSFDEYEDFDTFSPQAKDISFDKKKQSFKSIDDDDVLTSPYIHGDEPVYQPPQREYEDFDTKRQKERHEKPQKPKRKKRGTGFGKVIVSVLLVAAILFGCIFGYVYSLTAKLNHEDELGHENPYVSSYDLKSDNSVKNILLVGVDKADGGVSRSDTNLLVSIDKTSNKIKLISFMRDYWVEIPDNGSAKLNAACAYGGPELTVYTIEKNFGIKIDGFVMVDFDIFISLIDAVGGVEVEVTEKEAAFMRNQVTWTDVQSGDSVLLNGKEALLYCRIRYLDSDFMRTYRQRKVITALLNKAKSLEVLKLLPALDDVLPQITTNIPSLELTFTAVGAISYLGYEIEQLQVPFENTWSYGTINGQSVLLADVEEQKELLRDYMYN